MSRLIDVDLPQAARVPRAAEHALGAEVHDDPSARIDRDHPAAPTQLTQPHLEQFTYRLLETEGAELDRGADVMRRDRTNEIFTVTGGRDGTNPILRVRPGPDDRRIADAPLALVRHAARGGGGSEVARCIERHRADRALR